MSERKVVHVEPATGDTCGWLVKDGGKPVVQMQSKEDAVREAGKLVESHGPGQVKIHRQDGTFEEERIFGQDSPICLC